MKDWGELPITIYHQRKTKVHNFPNERRSYNASNNASAESSINAVSAPLDPLDPPGLCPVLPVYFEDVYAAVSFAWASDPGGSIDLV